MEQNAENITQIPVYGALYRLSILYEKEQINLSFVF